MKKQKLYPFTVGTGMSIENSTPEERKEIYGLLIEKGYLTFSKSIKEIMIESLKHPLVLNESGNFLLSGVVKVTNPLTYSQMKALITGDRTKLTHAQAVEKLKGGAQLRYCPNNGGGAFKRILILFPYNSQVSIPWMKYYESNYVSTNGKELYFRQNPIQGVEIIDLGDIEKETTNDNEYIKSLLCQNCTYEENVTGKFTKVVECEFCKSGKMPTEAELLRLKKQAKIIKSVMKCADAIIKQYAVPVPEYFKGDVEHKNGLFLADAPKGTEIFKTKSEFDNAISEKMREMNIQPSNHKVKELEKVEPVVGKWYKSDYCGGSLFCVTKTDKNVVSGYGFEKSFGWQELQENYWQLDRGFELATPEEVETALTNYAKAIGLVQGVWIIPCPDFYMGTTKDFRLYAKEYSFDGSSLALKNKEGYNLPLFYKGVWAKALKTRTRKEVEEELNIKIVD